MIEDRRTELNDGDQPTSDFRRVNGCQAGIRELTLDESRKVDRLLERAEHQTDDILEPPEDRTAKAQWQIIGPIIELTAMRALRQARMSKPQNPGWKADRVAFAVERGKWLHEVWVVGCWGKPFELPEIGTPGYVAEVKRVLAEANEVGMGLPFRLSWILRLAHLDEDAGDFMGFWLFSANGFAMADGEPTDGAMYEDFIAPAWAHEYMTAVADAIDIGG